MKRKYSGGMFSAGKRAAIIVPNNFPRIAVATVQRRQSVPVARSGMYRKSGFYGRFGKQAKDNGNRPELKYFDTALNFSFDTTGEVPATGQLALIPQGDTATTRDGRQATIKSIQIRGDLNFVPAANAVASGSTHLYLVQDRQCNGAATAVTNVLTSATFNDALINLENSDRFRILKAWHHTWGPAAGATTAYNNQTRHIEFYTKCDIPMTWGGTSGAIGEIRSNNIFLMAGSNDNGASVMDDTVTFDGACRLRFQG